HSRSTEHLRTCSPETDKTSGRAKPEPARTQLCNSVPCDCGVQSWQDPASASRAAFAGIKGSIRAGRPAEKRGDAGPQRRITWVLNRRSSRSGGRLELEQILDRLFQPLKIDRLGEMLREARRSGFAYVVFCSKAAECNSEQAFAVSQFAH